MAQGKLSLLIVSASILAASACGSEDDGAGGSGVDRDKKGSELSSAEAQDLCQASLDSGPNNEQRCTLEGLTFSADQETCESYAMDCLDERQTAEEICKNAKADLSECHASVGEIEDCIKAYNELLTDAISGLSCTDAGMSDAFGELMNLKIPDACKGAMDSCPGLLGG